MKTSDSIKNLLPALLEFHRKVDIVIKNKKNDYHNSKYATLDEIITICKPTLCECGLVIVQSVTETSDVTTYLYHAESCEYICDTIHIEPVVKKEKDGSLKPISPQDIGSNITYMQRYAYKSMLNIAFGDPDDDGNSASNIDAKKQKEILNERLKELDKPKIYIHKLTTEQWRQCMSWLETNIIVEKKYTTVKEAFDENYFYTAKYLHLVEERFAREFKDKLNK